VFGVEGREKPHADILHITGSVVTGARAYQCACVYCRDCTVNTSHSVN